MAILEQVKQMKSQGYQDSAIINYLQSQGVSPKEIQESLDQAGIMEAVKQKDINPPNYQQQYQPQENTQQNQEQTYSEDYPGYYEEQPPQDYAPTPQTQETYQNYSQQYPEQQYSNSQYPQEQYYQDSGYGYGQANSVAEIAEQVFYEKTKEIEKQLKEINEFKTLAQTKIENLTQRIKKIENIIDKLQIAVLEKIGSYGQNINSIKKEMSMMQDSFRKVAGSRR